MIIDIYLSKSTSLSNLSLAHYKKNNNICTLETIFIYSVKINCLPYYNIIK